MWYELETTGQSLAPPHYRHPSSRVIDLQEVMYRKVQKPKSAHFLQTSVKDLPKPASLLDLSKDRLYRGLPQLVPLTTTLRAQFTPHAVLKTDVLRHTPAHWQRAAPFTMLNLVGRDERFRPPCLYGFHILFAPNPRVRRDFVGSPPRIHLRLLEQGRKVGSVRCLIREFSGDYDLGFGVYRNDTVVTFGHEVAPGGLPRGPRQP